MSKRHAQGFTLIELIFFIVVVAVGLAGIQSVSTAVVKSSAEPLVRKQALAVAQSLLEEILLKEYAKPTDSTALAFANGGTRNLFDCVSDYTGYVTSGGIVDATGATVVGLSSYNITPAVSVLPAKLGTVDVFKVVVSVTGPGFAVTLTGYRGNY
jgi:MSHA pilin protein MshD